MIFAGVPSLDACRAIPYTRATIPRISSADMIAMLILRERTWRGVNELPSGGVETLFIETGCVGGWWIVSWQMRSYRVGPNTWSRTPMLAPGSIVFSLA